MSDLPALEQRGWFAEALLLDVLSSSARAVCPGSRRGHRTRAAAGAARPCPGPGGAARARLTAPGRSPPGHELVVLSGRDRAGLRPGGHDRAARAGGPSGLRPAPVAP